MGAVTTIVIVRDDLSVAGAVSDKNDNNAPKDENELFSLVHTKRPDVIVLDCRGANRDGMRAIARIRARVNTPILVVCDPGDQLQRKYRLAGASDCIEAPFDILAFNALLQEMAPSAASARAQNPEDGLTYHFEGVRYSPHESKLSGNEIVVKLTTLENRLLTALLQRQQRVLSRQEMAETLYGPHQPVSDRAIDVIVARLRKKIGDAGGASAAELLKTEFRLGYIFVGNAAVKYAAGQAAQEA
jgi:DNA-binding response OmpR family regulator